MPKFMKYGRDPDIDSKIVIGTQTDGTVVISVLEAGVN